MNRSDQDPSQSLFLLGAGAINLRDCKVSLVPDRIVMNASPRALQCYVVLQVLSRDTGACTATRRRIAAMMSVSTSTLDRALTELVHSNAIRRRERFEEDGSQLADEIKVLL